MAALAPARYRGGRSPSAFRDRAAKRNDGVRIYLLPRKVPDMSIDPRHPLPRTRTMCVAFFVFAAIAAIPQVAADETVTICHRPPGNPANAHTINVSINALPAHLGHSDLLGGCGCTAIEGVSCGENQPPCCAGLNCVPDITGVHTCQPVSASSPMPQGGACTDSNQCDPAHPCVFLGPNDGVCGG